MHERSSFADSPRLQRLAEKMHDKGYRDGYVASHARQVLAKQMREFRGEMSQSEFGEELGKPQTIVSRLENPSYSGWSLRTLIEVARRLNVAVFVRFVNFATFLKYSGDMSVSALHPEPYDQERLDQFVRAELDRQVAGRHDSASASTHFTQVHSGNWERVKYSPAETLISEGRALTSFYSGNWESARCQPIGASVPWGRINFAAPASDSYPYNEEWSIRSENTSKLQWESQKIAELVEENKRLREALFSCPPNRPHHRVERFDEKRPILLPGFPQPQQQWQAI
jgi:hypothetical protein